MQTPITSVNFVFNFSSSFPSRPTPLAPPPCHGTLPGHHCEVPVTEHEAGEVGVGQVWAVQGEAREHGARGGEEGEEGGVNVGEAIDSDYGAQAPG